MTEIEQRFFDLTNVQRHRNRLRPLVEATTLTIAANRHSVDMLRRRFFGHVNPDRKTHADRIDAVLKWKSGETAENIWMRSGPVTAANIARIVEEGIAQLMASRHHRANILSRRYTHMGMGVALTTSEVRVTQLFARFER
ncbi:MAG: CAP domain-containing protein [Acidobacteriota bacterium]|nr:CAP domain-containing protein [Acidobacteriota bacterium]